MWKLVVLCAAGCGRIAFDGSARTQDGNDIGPGVDCWPAWRSGAPTFGSVGPISELTAPDKQGNPWLTSDGRTLYFDTWSGNTEIQYAARTDPGQAFGSPVQLTELSSPLEESGFVMMENERLAVIASTRAGSSGFDLWQTERATASDPFDPPSRTPFAAIDDSFNQYDAFLTADGLQVYFSQNAVIGQVVRIATRTSTANPFGPPMPVAGMGTFGIEADPDLSPDGLVIVFSANNPLQLHAAVRASTAASFGSPFALSAIVGPSYDADPTFSANGCELIFISNRTGDRDLYLATVVP